MPIHKAENDRNEKTACFICHRHAKFSTQQKQHKMRRLKLYEITNILRGEKKMYEFHEKIHTQKGQFHGIFIIPPA